MEKRVKPSIRIKNNQGKEIKGKNNNLWGDCSEFDRLDSMMNYKNVTFCSSKNCKNKCGRKLTELDKQMAAKLGCLVSFAEFCDENGDLIGEKKYIIHLTSTEYEYIRDIIATQEIELDSLVDKKINPHAKTIKSIAKHFLECENLAFV